MNTGRLVEMNRDDFIIKMDETGLIFEDSDLRWFADEYFCNGESFEKNKEEFLKFIKED